MNNLPRRKWAFEKGRNSGGAVVAGAAAVTAASAALVLGIFRYDYTLPHDRKQSTVMTMFDPESDPELVEMLDRRDPARTYGVFGGGAAELLPRHRFRFERNGMFSPAVPDFPAKIPAGSVARRDLPVAAGGMPPPRASAGLSPAAPSRTRIILPDGGSVPMPGLTAAKRPPSPESVIRVSGAGGVLNTHVVRSCGIAAMDASAEKTLKTDGAAPGVYVVCWGGWEVKK